MSKRFSVVFRLKTPKSYVSGPKPIYLRITVDGSRVELSTQRDCEPDKWNAPANRAKGNKEDAKALNAFLESMKQKVHEAHRTLMDKGQTITPEKIKNQLFGNPERPKMILEVFQEHNDELAKLVGSEYAPLTLKRYRTALGHVRKFIKWKYRQSDRQISELDFEFIRSYEFYLKGIRQCAHNSTVKYLSNFKKVVLLCVKRAWLQRDPFYGFKLAPREIIRESLNQEELDSIISKKFSVERIKIVKDIFLFSCYTGLAYVDVHHLKRSEISTGIDGGKWIIIKRQKTETSARIPLLPICFTIFMTWLHKNEIQVELSIFYNICRIYDQ
jgi:hypothetical protein